MKDWIDMTEQERREYRKAKKKRKIERAIYTLLNIIQLFLACYGTGYLIDKYTSFHDPMRLGMFICIIAWCIAFYYYHIKDKPKKKE